MQWLACSITWLTKVLFPLVTSMIASIKIKSKSEFNNLKLISQASVLHFETNWNFERVTTFYHIWQTIAGKNRNRDKDIPRSIRHSIQDRFIHTLFSSVLNARPVKRRQKLKVFLHTNAQRTNVSFSLVTLYCWIVNSTAGRSIVKNLKLLHIYSCGNSKLWLKHYAIKGQKRTLISWQITPGNTGI